MMVPRKAFPQVRQGWVEGQVLVGVLALAEMWLVGSLLVVDLSAVRIL